MLRNSFFNYRDFIAEVAGYDNAVNANLTVQILYKRNSQPKILGCRTVGVTIRMINAFISIKVKIRGIVSYKPRSPLVATDENGRVGDILRTIDKCCGALEVEIPEQGDHAALADHD